jgi:hypothetical protein
VVLAVVVMVGAVQQMLVLAVQECLILAVAVAVAVTVHRQLAAMAAAV